MRRSHAFLAVVVSMIAANCSAQPPFNRDVQPGDSPQWGRTPHRNNVAADAKIPTLWNADTGLKLKWSMPLGSTTHGNVVVANGKVYVGTNNGHGYLERYSTQTDMS